MRKILLLIVILTSYPVLASCLIEVGDGTCTANLQAEVLPSMQKSSPLRQNNSPKLFTETPSNLDLSKNEKPIQKRDFGPNNTEYGYNSSCQFGVCMDTGAPKIFNQND